MSAAGEIGRLWSSLEVVLFNSASQASEEEAGEAASVELMGGAENDSSSVLGGGDDSWKDAASGSPARTL